MLRKEIEGSSMKVLPEGRLDSIRSPEFEEEVVSSIEGITYLEVDMKSVEYISSAGLRALLYLIQVMDEQGRIVITNVSPGIMEIFEATGFTDIAEIA